MRDDPCFFYVQPSEESEYDRSIAAYERECKRYDDRRLLAAFLYGLLAFAMGAVAGWILRGGA
jgi:hypothetical protein